VFHFYGVFKECKKSVLSHQVQLAAQEWMCRPPLNGFGSVEEVLAFLNKRFNHTCLGEVRRQNAIIKEILFAHQKNSISAGLESLLLVIFQPALQKIFSKYLWIDSAGDDLGQIIFSSFLEVVKNYPLAAKPDKIASKIVSGCKNRVYEWVLQEKKLLVEVFEDETPPKEKCDLKHEDTVVTLLDLAHGFGYDEATDSLCCRINQLFEKGVISYEEKSILIGQLVYGETLSNLVTEDEYEKLRKQINRLKKKYLS